MYFETKFSKSSSVLICFIYLFIVVYIKMGLDFHQILYRQTLWVKGRVASRWVLLCCHQSDYLSDKKNSKTI